MWRPIILKRVIPFFVAFAIGVLTSWTTVTTAPNSQKSSERVVYIAQDSPGSGASGPCSPDCGEGYSVPEPRPNQLSILSKPRPGYTDAARENNVQGTVRLRVVFQADGSVGTIQPLNSLPYGLTEQAIAAARKIRFEPKHVDGKPITVTKIVEYSFTIY